MPFANNNKHKINIQSGSSQTRLRPLRCYQWWMILIMLMVSVPSVITWSLVLLWLPSLNVLINGHTIEGTVSHYELLPNTETNHVIYYHWEDEHGSVHSSQINVNYSIGDNEDDDEEYSTSPYQPGDIIWLIADPENPHKHYVHPLSDLFIFIVVLFLGILPAMFSIWILLNYSGLYGLLGLPGSKKARKKHAQAMTKIKYDKYKKAKKDTPQNKTPTFPKKTGPSIGNDAPTPKA